MTKKSKTETLETSGNKLSNDISQLVSVEKSTNITKKNILETLELNYPDTEVSRQVPSKRWSFNKQNYTEEERQRFIDLSNQLGFLYIFGRECGKEKHRNHLQCYIEAPNKIRPHEIFKIPNVYYEHTVLKKSKGYNPKKVNYLYCSKEGDFSTNIIPDWEEEEKIIDLFNIDIAKDWQKDIIELTKSKPDCRSVYWFWSKIGNLGKTILAKHICINNKRAIYINGKSADIKFAISEMQLKPKVCIFGYPKDVENYVSYTALEEVKDAFFFSTKYESGMCLYNNPHVIVLSNFAPDTNKMMNDRWIINEIDENGYVNKHTKTFQKPKEKKLVFIDL